MERVKPTMRKTNIVMIDDEEDFCYFIKLNLEKTGRYGVFTATRGSDGIRLTASNADSRDLHRIRESSVTKCIPSTETSAAFRS